MKALKEILMKVHQENFDGKVFILETKVQQMKERDRIRFLERKIKQASEQLQWLQFSMSNLIKQIII